MSEPLAKTISKSRMKKILIKNLFLVSLAKENVSLAVKKLENLGKFVIRIITL